MFKINKFSKKIKNTKMRNQQPSEDKISLLDNEISKSNQYEEACPGVDRRPPHNVSTHTIASSHRI